MYVCRCNSTYVFLGFIMNHKDGTNSFYIYIIYVYMYMYIEMHRHMIFIYEYIRWMYMMNIYVLD